MTEERVPGAVVLTCPCCNAYLGALVQTTRAVATFTTICPECDNESRLFLQNNRVGGRQFPALAAGERGRRLP